MISSCILILLSFVSALSSTPSLSENEYYLALPHYLGHMSPRKQEITEILPNPMASEKHSSSPDLFLTTNKEDIVFVNRRTISYYCPSLKTSFDSKSPFQDFEDGLHIFLKQFQKRYCLHIHKLDSAQDVMNGTPFQMSYSNTSVYIPHPVQMTPDKKLFYLYEFPFNKALNSFSHFHEDQHTIFSELSLGNLKNLVNMQYNVIKIENPSPFFLHDELRQTFLFLNPLGQSLDILYFQYPKSGMPLQYKESCIPLPENLNIRLVAFRDTKETWLHAYLDGKDSPYLKINFFAQNRKLDIFFTDAFIDSVDNTHLHHYQFDYITGEGGKIQAYKLPSKKQPQRHLDMKALQILPISRKPKTTMRQNMFSQTWKNPKFTDCGIHFQA